jgi:hypothetical protein
MSLAALLRLPRQPSPLVPLAREADIARALDAYRSGARAIAITGGPGVGKSALLAEVARRIYAETLTPPAWLLADDAAAERAGTAFASDSSGTAPRRPSHVRLSSRSRGPAPLVCADDGEAAIEGVRTTVASTREPSPVVLYAARERLGLDGEVVVRLSPLDEAAAVHLFAALAEHEAGGPASVAAEVAASFGGNARALVGSARFARGTRGDEIAAIVRAGDEALRESLEVEWRRLEPFARDVWACCAQFGASFAETTLAVVVHAVHGPVVTFDAVANGVERLAARGLVEPCSSVDDASRRWVVPPPFRRFLRDITDGGTYARAVAGAMREVARRGASSPTWPASGRGVAILRAEAQNLMDVAASDDGSAGAWCVLALDALARARVPLRERVARLDRALVAAEREPSGDAEDLIPRIELARAALLLRAGAVEDATAACNAGLSWLEGDRADGGIDALLLATRAASFAARANASAASQDHDAARKRAVGSVRALVLAAAARDQVMLGDDPKRALPALEEAVRIGVASGDRAAEGVARAALARLLVETGESARGIAELTRAAEVETALGLPMDGPPLAFWLGVARQDLSAFAGAATAYSDAHRATTAAGLPHEVLSCRLYEALLALEDGRVADAYDIAHQAAAYAHDGRFAALHHVLVHVRALAGNVLRTVPFEEPSAPPPESLPPEMRDLVVALDALARAADETISDADANDIVARAAEWLDTRASTGSRSPLERIGRRLLARFGLDRRDPREPERVAAKADALRVSETGAWFEFDGVSVDLRGRRVLRRLLLRLALRASQDGTRVVTSSELFHAGWPDETLSRDVGIVRVHTAIKRLRDLGLAAVLRSDRSGYWIDGQVVFDRTPNPPSRVRAMPPAEDGAD